MLMNPVPFGHGQRSSDQICLMRGETTNLLIGAGDGNRTHVSSLGSYSSTIELHPRKAIIADQSGGIEDPFAMSLQTMLLQFGKRQLSQVAS